jgi:hypothetical protein
MGCWFDCACVELLLAFLGLKPLDDRAFWRRCVERPLRQRDSRVLLTLKVRRRCMERVLHVRYAAAV